LEVHQKEPVAILLGARDLKDRQLRAQSRTQGKARGQVPNQVLGQVLGQVRAARHQEGHRAPVGRNRDIRQVVGPNKSGQIMWM
jgi:hypothetical protein